LPEFADYSMKNRTYRYFTGKPLYGFGYGLSYTSFKYESLRLSSEAMHAGDSLTATVEVTNTGKREGDEVAELYLTPPTSGNGGLSPRVQLAGFKRVHLKPGESSEVSFTLDPRGLSEVDSQGIRSVQPGKYQISIGGAQPADEKAPAQTQRSTFAITGSLELPH
jgi:beta-glucosidase